jgi:hypothetical protein
VGRTGSGSCPMMGTGISSVLSSSSVTIAHVTRDPEFLNARLLSKPSKQWRSCTYCYLPCTKLAHILMTKSYI